MHGERPENAGSIEDNAGQDTHGPIPAQQTGFAANDLRDARTLVILSVHLPFIGRHASIVHQLPNSAKSDFKT
jgi:hypothetical protein